MPAVQEPKPLQTSAFYFFPPFRDKQLDSLSTEYPNLMVDHRSPHDNIGFMDTTPIFGHQIGNPLGLNPISANSLTPNWRLSICNCVSPFPRKGRKKWGETGVRSEMDISNRNNVTNPKIKNPQITGWCPPVISCFINPINYTYIYHKP